MSKTIYLKDYTPFSHRVETTHLTFDLHDDRTIVTSVVRYQLTIDNGQLTTLFLHGEDLELLSIMVDGVEIGEKQKQTPLPPLTGGLPDCQTELSRYQLVEGGIEIFDLPDSFLLTIVTEIHPETNTTLEGLYTSGGKFTTQCEAEGFRHITYYPDRPDVMSVFTVRVIADRDRYPVLLSNGNKQQEGIEGDRHFAVWHDPFPKPSYLFALVAGDLEYIEDFFLTMSGRNVTLRIFTESHNIPKCGFAMGALKRAMQWDEERFGREYDLDIFMIVAVDDFNAGAMENKGLNIFNSALVFATPESATDSDYIQIERVIGHEYFHNWTGDRVTCRDWFQLSLKEGLTVFRDHEFTSDLRGQAVKRIEDIKRLREHQFREDASPMAHPIRPQSFEEINNFYTLTVYEKGAEVIRMYETILGREGFRRGMDQYFEKYDGQAVTTEDFLSAMISGSLPQIGGVGEGVSSGSSPKIGEAGRGVGKETTHPLDPHNLGGEPSHPSFLGERLPQMQTWYDQAGTPTVRVETVFDAVKKTFSIHFTQSTPPTPECQEKRPFLIPIRFGLFDRETSREILLPECIQYNQKATEGLFLMTEATGTLVIEWVEREPIPSWLRGFSAPVQLVSTLSDGDLLFLARHDTDPFARYEAGQEYLTRHILTALQTGKSSLSSAFLGVFFENLTDESLAMDFRAMIAAIPSEQEIANRVGTGIDPEKIANIRDTLVHQIATEGVEILSQLFQQLDIPTPYVFTQEAVAQRKLKNLILSYLVEVWSGEYLLQIMQRSENMTEYFPTFSLLMEAGGVEKNTALDEFLERWKGDSNVMNKWFSAQAGSRLITIADLDSLWQHPLLDQKNPNNIRSICTSFALNNPRQFHTKDGSGYQWIADRVIEIDGYNPQVAARLVRSMMSWRDLEPVRSGLLRAELVRIAHRDKLSADVGEIVRKSLGGR